MKKVFFKTFGCRTNIYDTQIMIDNVKEFIVTQNESEADIVVVNSCTVTNGADSGVRNYINHLKDKRVIIAGCGAFSQGKSLQKSGKVFGVMGHSKKDEINRLLKSDTSFFELGNLDFLDKDIVVDYQGKTKAFLKIQEGCNFRCSYCIIPYVRGNARSQEEKKILEQVRILSQNGYSEFVLTGTNIGSYGKDRGSSLGKLLKKIFLIRGVKRLRLGSIEPVQIDDDFKEILEEEALERHLHIALQHTSEDMLKLMRRRNHLKGDLALFEELASKGFALGSDFIVGHPGESEQVWQEALENFKHFPLTHLHAFIYSKREGTPSATLKPSVNGKVAKERLKCLQDIVYKNNADFRSRQKGELLVHVESEKNGIYQGYDQFYNILKIKSNKNLLKSWLRIDKYKIGGEFNEAIV